MTPVVVISYSGEKESEGSTDEIGKFLQFVFRGREYLVFASIEAHRYHIQILARFLEENGIAHHWLGENRLEVDEADFRVVGGGRYQVRPQPGILDLWDNSQAYGRFDEDGLEAKIAGAGHPWSRFRVVIR